MAGAISTVAKVRVWVKLSELKVSADLTKFWLRTSNPGQIRPHNTTYAAPIKSKGTSLGRLSSGSLTLSSTFDFRHLTPSRAHFLDLASLLAMPARPAFTGLRKTFLVGELEKYSDAVLNGTKDDFVKDVIRRYFKRFPPELPHDQEPTQEHLAAVDDTMPDPEPAMPDAQDYAEDQTTYYALEAAWEKRQAEITTRSGQIARWLAYHQPKASNSSDPNDFINVMKRRILGGDIKKPRKSTAVNVWVKKHQDIVDKAYAEAAKGKPADTKRVNLGLRTKVAQQLFAKLPRDSRRRYAKLAEKEHRDELRAWEAQLKKRDLTPEEKQICIDGVASVLQPVFNAVLEFTGWRVTCILGGPEPADNGRLNIVRYVLCFRHSTLSSCKLTSCSIHIGQTQGAVKLNFGEHDPQKYQTQIVALFSDFLRKCFTREDCLATAIGPGTTPALSILAPDNVEHCHAAGENYGPSTDTSSQDTKRRNPRKKTRQSEELFVPDSEDERNARMQVDRDDDDEGEEAIDMSQPRSPVNQDSDYCSGAASAGDDSTPLPAHPHKAAQLTPLRSLFSSPLFSDISPFSDSNGHPSSPAPPSPSPARHHVQGDGTLRANTTEDQNPSLNASQQPVRCGPPRKGGANAGWRLKKSNAASTLEIPTSSIRQEGEGAHVTRPPTASARVLVPSSPLLTQAPCPRGADTFDVAQNISRKLIDAVNGGTGSGEPTSSLEESSAPPNAASSSRKRRDHPHQTDRDSNSKRPRKGVSEGQGNDGTTHQKRKVVFMGGPPFLMRLKPSGASGPRRRPQRTSDISTTAMPSPPSSLSPPPTTPALAPPARPHFVLPPDVPAAVRSTLELVQSGCWGKAWEDLIKVWLDFEESRGFTGNSKLGSTHRPPAISHWIQRARRPAYRPDVDVSKFQAAFWKWWIGLQPEWRAIEADATSREVGGEWDDLDKAGANGLASVMAGLFFWGYPLHEQGGEMTSWKLAVADVCWVLSQLSRSK
ncbi:hypothetical protein CVT26_002422 [Gymnopilus dilepis]|uniref:Uncharacterized protein n=1 Tax=Gymnopilus dilepis TaxID=231916 RepID=A0A409WE95_9AGAR|nr:hypothetical protein CVT26_002422 [Gymnopilus dilepis]